MKKKIIIIICICILVGTGIGMYQFGFKNGAKKEVENCAWRWNNYQDIYGKIIDEAIDNWCIAEDKKSYEEYGYPTNDVECLNWYMEKVYQEAIKEGLIPFPLTP